MRVLLAAVFALSVAACAGGGGLGAPVQSGTTVHVPINEPAPNTAWPFPQAPRGSAIPPPQAAAPATQAAPPEGPGAGGLDFGRWRSADPATYSPQFQTQIRQRFAGRDAAAIRADLEHNGFVCEAGAGLQCRLETLERQCAYNWYVVVEQGQS